MMRENGGLAVRPRATALTSVSLMGGTVSHSESGLYGGSAMGGRPAAGSGLLCCIVAVAEAGCELVASSVALFLQQWWIRWMMVNNCGSGG